MIISMETIRRAMRKRMVQATGINPVAQLKTENKNFDQAGKSLWIDEHIIGGKEQQLSIKRSRIPAFLIQYDVCAPKNSGSSAAESAATAIASEFNLADESKNSVFIPGLDINVKELTVETDNSGNCYKKIVLITLDISTVPQG
jgi:hypothetical protein